MTSLSLVWIYVLVLIWRKNWVEALIASCILGGSWELAYQARWIAPDGVLMQFGALTMIFVVLTQTDPRKQLWLRCAAITAGLACSTKYPGGLFIVPVIIAAYQMAQHHDNRKQVYKLIIESIVIFGIVYLIVTPGTILQPHDFYTGIYNHDVLWYGDSHMGYTITPGLPHFQRITTYLTTNLLSPYGYGALIFFVMSAFGVYNLYKEDISKLYLYVSFPFLYIVYFSMQHVMIIRNLLVLIPFIAVLSARGFIVLWNYYSAPINRIILGSVTTLLLLLNSYWLFETSQTIVHRTTSNPVAELAEYIDERQITSFYLTDKLKDELFAYDGKTRTNVTTNLYPLTHSVVFYATEGFDDTSPANDPALTSTWFGPWEVNFNYYPTWAGYDRIIVMPYTKAYEAHVNIFKQK